MARIRDFHSRYRSSILLPSIRIFVRIFSAQLRDEIAARREGVHGANTIPHKPDYANWQSGLTQNELFTSSTLVSGIYTVTDDLSRLQSV